MCFYCFFCLENNINLNFQHNIYFKFCCFICLWEWLESRGLGALKWLINHFFQTVFETTLVCILIRSVIILALINGYNHFFLVFLCFLKPFIKGKNFAVWERGKFDFSHYFAFLTIFLKVELLLDGIFFGWPRKSFSQKNCQKRTFRSDFVKLGSEILYLSLAEILYLFLAEKWSLFVCFANLSDFGLL